MNFSHPEPIKLNTKKPSKLKAAVEKIGAFIGLMEAAGGMGMPDKVKNNITPKQRDRIILVLVLLIIYFILMGIFATFYFLIKLF